MSEPQTYRVAVVAFVEVNGAVDDQQAAEHYARLVVDQKLRDQTTDRTPYTAVLPGLPTRYSVSPIPVTVHDVTTLWVAANSGRLDIQPTARPFAHPGEGT